MLQVQVNVAAIMDMLHTFEDFSEPSASERLRDAILMLMKSQDELQQRIERSVLKGNISYVDLKSLFILKYDIIFG